MNVLQAIQVCPEEESILMTSFVDTLAHLQGREGKEGSEFDFQVRTVYWFHSNPWHTCMATVLIVCMLTPTPLLHESTYIVVVDIIILWCEGFPLVQFAKKRMFFIKVMTSFAYHGCDGHSVDSCQSEMMCRHLSIFMHIVSMFNC